MPCGDNFAFSVLQMLGWILYPQRHRIWTLQADPIQHTASSCRLAESPCTTHLSSSAQAVRGGAP